MTLHDFLTPFGQEHLAAHAATLPAPARAGFEQAVRAVRWSQLASPYRPPSVDTLSAGKVVTPEECRLRFPLVQAAGERAYAEGRVAVIMLAGGAGTRLGVSGPKGCVEAFALSRASIYQHQAEKVLALQQRYRGRVPFLIMTSTDTDDATRAFFRERRFFGLPESDVTFFVQGTVPSLSQTGKALLAAPGQLLMNADGHGGCFTALQRAGLLASLQAQGVTVLMILQVDNLLCPVDDPLRVGLITGAGYDVVVKTLLKRDPDEKQGQFVTDGSVHHVIEYTDTTSEQRRKRDADGGETFRYGSPAIHSWSLAFLQALAAEDYLPPLHWSAKPLLAWTNGAAQEVPGFKCEGFFHDMVSHSQRAIGLLIPDRDREFAAIKNRAGAFDTVAHAQQLVEAEQRRWVAAAGVSLPPGVQFEVRPTFAATAESFAERWSALPQDQRRSLAPGAYVFDDRGVRRVG